MRPRHGCLPRLLEMATSPSEDAEAVRWRAIRAVAKLGHAKELHPLLDEPDLPQDLLGALLEALWPDHLDPRALFDRLPTGNVSNRMDRFMWKADIADRLDAAGLEIALRWAARVHPRSPALAPRELAGDIILAAWSQADEPRVRAAFAGLLRVISHHWIPIKVPWHEDEARRHDLIEALIAGTPPGQLESVLRFGVGGLVGSADAPWMLERHDTAQEPLRSQWVRAVFALWARGLHPDLIDRVGALPGALEARPDVFGHVELTAALSLSATEPERGWRRVNDWLMAHRPPPEKPPLGAWLEADLTALAAWDLLPGEVRESIVAAALAFVERCRPPPITDWLGELTRSGELLAAERAWWLLAAHEIEPEATAWATWSGLLLDPWTSRADHTLARRCREQAPEAWADAVAVLCAKVDVETSARSLAERLIACLDLPGVPELLEARVAARSTHAECRRWLLAGLLGEDMGLDVAKRLVDMPGVGEAIIDVSPRLAWEQVWPRMQADSDLARRVLRKLLEGPGRRWAGWVEAAGDDEIVRFHAWLIEHHPELASSENMRRLPEDLVASGRHQALSEMGFEQHARRARRRVAQETGRPTIEELVALQAPIDSVERLLEAVTGTLEDIQAVDLDGDWGQAGHLWDERSADGGGRRKIRRPWDEDRLNRWLGARLDARLRPRGVAVIAEPREGPANRRTDLRLEIDDHVVKLEAKGVWHGKASSALAKQLTGGYLATNPAAAGCYVLYWPAREDWTDTTDSRLAGGPPAWREDPEKARTELSAQAAAQAPRLVKSFVLRIGRRPE